MPRDLFDDVARNLTGFGSRRALLHLVAAALGTGWTNAPPVATTAPKRRCQKLAKACSKRKKCCPGTRCGRGRCRCPATKKPCGRACIARAACCPATEEPCDGQCVPKGACCTAQQQRCGNRCIPRSACCHDQDCIGPCDIGTCRSTNQCALAAAGTPCGADSLGQCDTGGTCTPIPCADSDDCPEPAHWCRLAACDQNHCTATWRASGVKLPDHLQIPGDCHFLICDESAPDGIFFHVDDLDVLDDPHPCIKSTCSTGSPRTEPRPVDYVCDEEHDRVCDADQQCVPRS